MHAAGWKYFVSCLLARLIYEMYTQLSRWDLVATPTPKHQHLLKNRRLGDIGVTHAFSSGLFKSDGVPTVASIFFA